MVGPIVKREAVGHRQVVMGLSERWIALKHRGLHREAT